VSENNCKFIILIYRLTFFLLVSTSTLPEFEVCVPRNLQFSNPKRNRASCGLRLILQYEPIYATMRCLEKFVKLLTLHSKKKFQNMDNINFLTKHDYTQLGLNCNTIGISDERCQNIIWFSSS